MNISDLPGAASNAADRWLAEAVGHFNAGRLAMADALCARILQAQPRNTEALTLCAAILLQRGQPAMAVELLGRAIRANGQVAALHHNQANILLQMGRIEDAARGYRRALGIDPQSVDSCYQLALCHRDQGQEQAAIACFTAVLIWAPEVAEAYHQRGISALMAAEQSQATALFRRAVTCQPDFTDAITNLAILLQEQGQREEARLYFRLAMMLRPEDAFIINNLSTLLKDIDEREDVTPLLRRAVLLAPDSAEFHYALAMSRTFTAGDGALLQLQTLLGREALLPAAERHFLHFALAKAYEDLGEKSVSFRHQLLGNRLKRATFDYDEAKVADSFARIRRSFSAVSASSEAGDPSDLPIFILGMPRSGSSLVEQILASHPDVYGAGELPDLPMLVAGLGEEPGQFFPEIVGTLAPQALRALGAQYVEGLRRRAPDARRITDKMPSNFQLIGLIRRVLPNARIIHTRRDAVDTCLSIFSKLFSEPVPYAYDLAELGRFWRQYESMMRHWRESLPAGSFLDLDYEEMVADQEGQTRRLLEFCGLPWHDACLQFHRTARVVKTASKMQVRKPLYASSVGRWRPDRALLAPLLTELGVD